MDSEYLHWLEINHPDSVPADRHMIVLAPESSGGVSKDNPTLTDVFSFVQPSSPLTMTECATSSDSPFINSHASTTESDKTSPTFESTHDVSTTKSTNTPPSLESTLHVSTTKSAKSVPSLESTPHTSTKSARTP